MRYSVEKFLKSRDIDPQKIDVEAIWDSSLTQKENFNKLREEVGKLGKRYKDPYEEYRSTYDKKAVKKRQRNFGFKEINRKRSTHAKRIDRALKAPKVEFEKWRKNPDQYDLKGHKI